MCGICASIGPDALKYAAEVKAGAMTLAHRGPDAAGEAHGQHFVLGHRRLAILGSAPVAAQPFSYRGQFLAYNGEVHNYRELRSELTALGHTIPEGSDVPVVAAALDEWGLQASERFDGFFAFVFVRPATDDVIIARDRFGQKPLCFSKLAYEQRTTWLIASEEKALQLFCSSVASPGVQQIVIARATYPVAPATCFAQLQQFLPGEALTITLSTGEVTNRLSFVSQVDSHLLNVTSSTILEKVQAALQKSITQRLRADVPVGLLLSAGLDSGAVRGIVPSDSIDHNYVFDDQSATSELHTVEREYGEQHPLEVAQLNFQNADEFRVCIDRLHTTIGAPLLSGSLLGLDALFAKAAQCGTPVVLSGQGADELFAGYNYYQDDARSWLAQISNRVAKLGGLQALPSAVRDLRQSQRLLQHLRLTTSVAPPSEFSARRQYDLFGGPLSTMLWYEDRIAMSHSIEVRYPFLQLDLLALTQNMSYEELTQGQGPKGLLRKAVRPYLSKHLQYASPKQGFPANEERLIRQFPSVFKQGLAQLEQSTGTATGRLQEFCTADFNLGPRVAKVLFRAACTGLWYQQCSPIR